MQYVRLNTGLNSYKLIPASDDVYDHVKDNNKDHYSSLFFYNEDQYKIWKTTGSLSGIKDVTTNRVFFDFDSKQDLSVAQRDTQILVNTLITAGINKDNIQIAFSGSKGFSVEIESNVTFTPEELKNLTKSLATGLSTYDPVVYDPQRIVRLIGTRHQTSKLFKIPLSTNDLFSKTTEQIKAMAKDIDSIDTSMMDGWKRVTLPEEVIKLKQAPKKEEKVINVDASDLDFTMRPKWLSEVRYALQEGFFPTGEGVRNHAFLILCATYRKNGFSKIASYRLLKTTAELQAQRNNSEPYSKEELWKNVVSVVYSDTWQGGIYKDNEDAFLVETAKRLGIKLKVDETEYNPRHIHSIHDKFKDYVKNIEKNTILTGIKSLDEKVFISVGANVGIVGAPGSGKSSLALNILNNTSKAGIKTVFASFDMAATRIYEKLLYKITGLRRDVLYDIIKNDPKREQELYQKVQEEFGNVYFYDKSAASVEDIKEYIIKCNELASRPEDKVKLVMIDYFEMISSDVGDDTASSKKVAQQLQGIVNTMDVAQIVLLQPNKMSGDMREPITSYTNIKGSSFLAQSFRIALGIYREGYDPTNSNNDKFLTINILKNDLGDSGSLDYSWNGKRGQIQEIDDNELQALDTLRKQLATKKIAESDL